jgi:hypothetical protein
MLGINADIQSKAFILLSNRLRELSQSISELKKNLNMPENYSTLLLGISLKVKTPLRLQKILWKI